MEMLEENITVLQRWIIMEFGKPDQNVIHHHVVCQKHQKRNHLSRVSSLLHFLGKDIQLVEITKEDLFVPQMWMIMEICYRPQTVMIFVQRSSTVIGT